MLRPAGRSTSCSSRSTSAAASPSPTTRSASTHASPRRAGCRTPRRCRPRASSIPRSTSASSPAPSARQQGLLAGLEQYYRTEDAQGEAVRAGRRRHVRHRRGALALVAGPHDSARSRYVAFRARGRPQGGRRHRDADLRRLLRGHKARVRPAGRAVVSVVAIPRVVTAADTAAVRAAHPRAAARRSPAGAKFEDVARRESSDSVHRGADGGTSAAARAAASCAEFEAAAYALAPGSCRSRCSRRSAITSSRRRAQGRHARAAPHPPALPAQRLLVGRASTGRRTTWRAAPRRGTTDAARSSTPPRGSSASREAA